MENRRTSANSNAGTPKVSSAGRWESDQWERGKQRTSEKSKHIPFLAIRGLLPGENGEVGGGEGSVLGDGAEERERRLVQVSSAGGGSVEEG